MSEAEQSLKLTRAINYRATVAHKAKKLLEKLLTPFCDACKNSKELQILVIGAGTFPSYIPLLTVLRQKMPFLQSVHFFLVEPETTEISFFQNHFAGLANEKTAFPKITVSTFNQEVKDFLHAAEKNHFDLVYFEHPEVMTLPVILAKFGIKRFKKSISLRQSFPYLAAVFKPRTWIIASCMSHHELSQLNSLLKFSFKIDSCKMHSRLVNYFYGGPYCSGLVCSCCAQGFSDAGKHAKSIRKSDNNLFIVLMLSFIVYCIKFSKPYFFIEQILAIAIMYVQLLWHRPGLGGLMTKTLLLAALIIV